MIYILMESYIKNMYEYIDEGYVLDYFCNLVVCQ